MSWSRSYAGYSRSVPKEVKENPNLGSRLEKIKKENLAANTREFVESLLDFFNKRGGLTENQLIGFEKIESRWSPQEKVKLKIWEKEYRAEHLSDAKIIAEYYSRTGYFSTVANNIISDESFVPSQKTFNRMMKNKYAAKVLAAHKAEPRFIKDSMVQLRASVGATTIERHLRSLKSRICFVLANDLPIRNATVGAKRYKVLPMSSTDPIEVDEKHLMKPNKKGKYS